MIDDTEAEAEPGPREQVYDREIAPLMAKVIAIAEAHGIPTFAAFALDNDRWCEIKVGEGAGANQTLRDLHLELALEADR